MLDLLTLLCHSIYSIRCCLVWYINNLDYEPLGDRCAIMTINGNKNGNKKALLLVRHSHALPPMPNEPLLYRDILRMILMKSKNSSKNGNVALWLPTDFLKLRFLTLTLVVIVTYTWYSLQTGQFCVVHDFRHALCRNIMMWIRVYGSSQFYSAWDLFIHVRVCFMLGFDAVTFFTLELERSVFSLSLILYTVNHCANAIRT